MNDPHDATRHLLDWHGRLGLLVFAVLLGIIAFGFGAML